MKKFIIIKFIVIFTLYFVIHSYAQIPIVETTNLYYSPIISENYILFIVTNQAKIVKLLLESEGWKPIPMVYDDKVKIWYYIYEKNLKKGKYRYKLSVDNILIVDPMNTNRDPDPLGGYFSVFELKNDIEVLKGNPKPLGNGYYEFRYKNLNAEKVILVGSFNNWSPYELEMKREYGGIWKIRVFLPKGVHYYYFIVDDEIVNDPLNMKTVRDKNGNVMSIVEVN